MKRESEGRTSAESRKRARSESLQSEDDITLREDQPTPTPLRHRSSRTSLKRISKTVFRSEVSGSDQESSEDDVPSEGIEDEVPVTPSKQSNIRNKVSAGRNGGTVFVIREAEETEADPADISEEETTEQIEEISPSKLRSNRKSLGSIGRPITKPEFGKDIIDSIQNREESREGTQAEILTPKRKRGRPKGSKNVPRVNGFTPVKSKLGENFRTPTKLGEHTSTGTHSIPGNLDRSARRKSARAILERTIDDNISEDEDEELARQIYSSDEGEEHDTLDESGENHKRHSGTPLTPSKRGRPKGTNYTKTCKRSPTPPRELPPHELYFAQNKAIHSKTSNNTLANLSLLTHEEYFTLTRAFIDPHAQDLSFLEDLHSRSFSQWAFELEQNFNILLYGFGSKRSILTLFATYLSGLPSYQANTHQIVICNGYLSNTSLRDLFATIAQALISQPQKLGSQPPEMLENLLRLLSEHPEAEITLLINSIDSASLRRSAIQNLLARLSDHERVHLIATADHPNFPLIWDSSLRSTYNFVFHDCTTFRAYSAEVDVVDEVHALLGRSGRRVGGKEGVAFVLKSLSQRSRELFGVLVGEQLLGMEDGLDSAQAEADVDMDNDDGDDGERFGFRKTGGSNGKKETGVEYNVLLQKVMIEFICPDEMMFRTLLKEFYDHQMITSKKDALGTEILTVPFRKEELEAILEDLMS